MVSTIPKVPGIGVMGAGITAAASPVPDAIRQRLNNSHVTAPQPGAAQPNKQPRSAPAAAPVEPRAGFLRRTFDSVASIPSKIMDWDFNIVLSGFVTVPAAFMVRRVGGLVAPQWAEKAGNWLQLPATVARSATFEQAGGVIRKLPLGDRVVNGMGAAAGKAAGAVAAPLAWVADRTGLSGWRAGKHAADAKKFAQETIKFAQSNTIDLAGVDPNIAGHLNGLHEAAKNGRDFTSHVSAATQELGKIAEKNASIMETVGYETNAAMKAAAKAQAVAQKVEDLKSKGATSAAIAKAQARADSYLTWAQGKAQKVLNRGILTDASHAGVVTKLKDVVSATNHAAFNTAVKGVEGVTESLKNATALPPEAHALLANASNATGSSRLANGWGNIKDSIKNAPKAMSKASIAGTAVNGALLANAGVGLAYTGIGFNDGLHSLKALYTDITGQKASTFKVLFGSVPPEVKEQRKALEWSMGSQGVMQGISAVLSVRQILTGKFNMKMMFGQMGLAAAAGPLVGLVSGEPKLKLYDMFRQARAGGQAPVEAYAMMIAEINPRYAKLTAKHQVTMAVAAKLAQSNMGLGELLKLNSAGQLEHMGNAVVAEMKKNDTHTVPSTLHQDRLNGHSAANNLEKLGPKTGAVIQERVATADGPNHQSLA